jgi:hypothetical protein
MKLALEILGSGVAALLLIGIIIFILAVFFTDYSK